MLVQLAYDADGQDMISPRQQCKLKEKRTTEINLAPVVGHSRSLIASAWSLWVAEDPV